MSLPIPLPDAPDVPYGTLKGRLAALWADGDDTGPYPDVHGLEKATAVLRASIPAVVHEDDAGVRTSFILKPISLEVSPSTGALVPAGSTQTELRLPATSGPGMEPSGWRYTLTWTIGGVTLPVMPFQLHAGEVLDVADLFLSSAAAVPDAPTLFTDLRLQADRLEGLLADGGRGFSAFDVAVMNGFVGTEAEWLESLRGEKGDTPSLPAISWEGDRLRVGDALSDPLAGPGGGVTETASTVTRGAATTLGSLTLTRLGRTCTLTAAGVRAGGTSAVLGSLPTAADRPAATTLADGWLTDATAANGWGVTVGADGSLTLTATPAAATILGGSISWRASA